MITPVLQCTEICHLFSASRRLHPPHQSAIRSVDCPPPSRESERSVETAVFLLTLEERGFAPVRFPLRSAHRNALPPEMDEDFFKDYPPVNGNEQPSATTNDAPAPSDDGGMGAFVLGDTGTNGDDAAAGDDGGVMGTNGGPPPDDNAEPECAAVTEWRAAFAKGLEEKVANERTVKAERAEQARAALEAMHGRWETTRRNAEDANIKSEKQFLQTRDGVISRMSKPGENPNWDIVPELVDMTGKYKEGARDTSRMRQVLLRMKTN